MARNDLSSNSFVIGLFRFHTVVSVRAEGAGKVEVSADCELPPKNRQIGVEIYAEEASACTRSFLL